MKILIVTILYILTGMSYSHSQEQPRPVPPVVKETKRTSEPKGNPNNKQTIAIELPPTINVTIGGKLETQSDNHNEKRHDESPNWAEWLIALFTGLLVCVTGILARYTYLLWESTAKSFNLSREDHIATHRPKLVVRRIAINEIRETGTCEVQYIVVNVGPGRARIIETGTRLWLPDRWPAIIPDIETIEPRDNVESSSGNELRFTYHVVDPDLIETYGFRSAEGNEQPIIFYGYILYLDNLNRPHRTGFLRHFDRTIMRFTPINDHDYEYQD